MWVPHNWPFKFQTTSPFIIKRTKTGIFDPPNLYSGVHVIVDVVVLQHAVAVVIEVDPNLLTQQQDTASQFPSVHTYR